MECTAGRSELCADGELTFVCDVLTQACTTEEPGSAGACEPCLSDAHCGPGLWCVPMPPGDGAGGHYCQPELDPGVGCVERPYVQVALAVATLEGQMVGVCTPPAAAACSAYNGYGDACGVDAEGEPVKPEEAGRAVGGSDALCQQPGGLCVNTGSEATEADYRCTVRCGSREAPSDDDCPAVSVLSEERTPRCVVPVADDREPYCGF